MSDIVERLRDPTYSGSMRHLQDWSEIDALMTESADQIEWLSAEAKARRESEIETLKSAIAAAADAAAEILRLRQELVEARAGLERLAMPLAFITSRATNEEERARMFYAEAILKGGIEDAEAYAVKRACSIAEKEG